MVRPVLLLMLHAAVVLALASSAFEDVVLLGANDAGRWPADVLVDHELDYRPAFPIVELPGPLQREVTSRDIVDEVIFGCRAGSESAQEVSSPLARRDSSRERARVDTTGTL